ncbi:hypothetical protein L915_00018 [Phytophthora nicotianae]|uniref:Uncharacterized protein n=1 Tax=Phytophthora nicotianae TaxID=4792 RepID=W2PAU9_PHYNI|nr:hypothetical protein L915_00018 [Phytophthora nicotianae]ETL50787.1 hypothetical protein L916_00012 [Phytophthora nicotianae]ETM57109.1 hypothetical protein L914_00011 [Phytophthora nicotianae]
MASGITVARVVIPEQRDVEVVRITCYFLHAVRVDGLLEMRVPFAVSNLPVHTR